MVADRLITFEGRGRRVHVCADVAATWNAHRQISSHAAESFGVLIGTTSIDRTQVWIEVVSTPRPLDTRWRFGFRMRDPGHERLVRTMHKRSCRTRIYLGTWHTHPALLPAPSRLDRRDWTKCLRMNPSRPLVFVVVGTEQIGIFVRVRRTFKAIAGVETWT